mmetsp:Transcript_19153/g.52837  ORF Transcript_19153/g.52837 Transcript_19153/m.52837 type:complete len:160 (+) Transcript_19153:90-569(+)
MATICEVADSVEPPFKEAEQHPSRKTRSKRVALALCAAFSFIVAVVIVSVYCLGYFEPPMVYTEADVRRQMESLNDFNVTESTQLVFNLHDFNNDRVIDSKDVEEFKKYTNDNASSVVEMSISNIARHAPVNESKFQENKEFFRKLDSGAQTYQCLKCY